MKEMALQVSNDAEQRFELALSLNKLDVAIEIARETASVDKWKLAGDIALKTWNVSTFLLIAVLLGPRMLSECPGLYKFVASLSG